jgi:photosystem II stability/assembly factor-like uncharacterized protein
MKYFLSCISIITLLGCHEKPAIQSSYSTDKAIDKSTETKPTSKVAPLKDRSPSPDGWSWLAPKPNGYTALGLWARSLEEFYAVGDNGLILLYEKGVLRAVESNTRTFLGGVWGTGDGEVFVVGAEGTILRSQQGGAFVKQESPTKARLRSVWGTSSKNVFAVGDGGTILRFDGENWSQQKIETTAALSAISGRNTKDIYAVGEAGTVLRFDGEEWSLADTGTSAVLYAVGVFGNQVVACGAGGTLLRSTDGISFVAEELAAKGTLLTLFASPDNSAGRTGSFFATGPKDIVAFDGKAFTSQIFNGDPIIAVSWKEKGGVFANASGRIYVRQGDQNIEVTQGSRGQFNDIAFDKDGSGTIASDDGIYSFDGNTWTLVEATRGAFFEGVTGAGVGDLAVGPAGLIMRKTASGNWVREESGTNAWLTDVYIASHAEVFVVGHQGVVLQREEATETWKVMPTPTSFAFSGISGRGAAALYLVGEAGMIYRFDGKVFTSEASPVALDLKAVSCEGKEIFAVGKKGLILRRSAEGWVKEESGVSSDLFGVYGTTSGEAYAVGDRGVVLYRSAEGIWRKQDSDARGTLLAVSQGVSGMVVVGGGGAILQKKK